MIFMAAIISRQFDPLDMALTEFEPHRQQRPERIVSSGPGMKGVKEQLGLSVEPRRDRGMARRRPLPRGLEQRFALLGVRPERMIGDRNADAISRSREVVAGVKQPVSAVLPGHEWALDKMAFPVEIVGEDDPIVADQR